MFRGCKVVHLRVIGSDLAGIREAVTTKGICCGQHGMGCRDVTPIQNPGKDGSVWSFPPLTSSLLSPVRLQATWIQTWIQSKPLAHMLVPSHHLVWVLCLSFSHACRGKQYWRENNNYVRTNQNTTQQCKGKNGGIVDPCWEWFWEGKMKLLSLKASGWMTGMFLGAKLNVVQLPDVLYLSYPLPNYLSFNAMLIWQYCPWTLCIFITSPFLLHSSGREKYISSSQNQHQNTNYHVNSKGSLTPHGDRHPICLQNASSQTIQLLDPTTWWKGEDCFPFCGQNPLRISKRSSIRSITRHCNFMSTHREKC